VADQGSPAAGAGRVPRRRRRLRCPLVGSDGHAMIPARTTSTQKAAGGWPPVASKNLRSWPSSDASLKQKSRLAAAPRRSGDETCEKPPTDRISLPRCTATWQQQTVSVPAEAAASVPLLSRQTVHLQTGPYNNVAGAFAVPGFNRQDQLRQVTSLPTDWALQRS